MAFVKVALHYMETACLCLHVGFQSSYLTGDFAVPHGQSLPWTWTEKIQMSGTAQSLEDRFLSFLGQQQDAESIDNTMSEAELGNGKRADFLLDKRQIILEVKTLKSDPAYKVDEKLNPHRARPEFPAFYWKAGLDEILPHLPDGEVIRREIFHAVTRAVQGGFESADDQIAATKRSLNLQEACGVVAFLNEDIAVLAPQLVTAKASQMLLKKRSGAFRYTNIAYAWIISEAHHMRGLAGPKSVPLILLEGPTSHRYHAAGQYLEALQPAWAAFQGKPFHSIGEVQSFDGITFQQHAAADDTTANNGLIPPDDLWRREYRQNPYLRSLTEIDFLAHTASILRTMTPHFVKDGEKLPERRVRELMVRWTHALEEAEYRRLDMRKLRSSFGDQPID